MGQNVPIEIILNGMTEGVLVTDEKSRIVRVNPSLQSMLKLEEDCIGKRLLECLRNPQIHETIEQVFKTGAAQEKEVSLSWIGEEKNLMVHSSPLINLTRIVGAVSVFNDVTLLRRLEKIRRDFVANVSHELKTPLTNIRGFAETLKQGAIHDPEAALPFLEKIENNARHLEQLVEDILKLSEVESGRLELNPSLFPLGDLTERVRENFAHRLQSKNLKWVADIPMVFSVHVDNRSLNQILSNLIDNAIKYTPDGGTITIAATFGADHWTLQVADTGIGISPDDMPRIFERFYRADRSRSREVQGTGLGLAIVKHRVQGMGGEISVDSLPGKGTRFFLMFPTRTKTPQTDFNSVDKILTL